MDALAWLPSVVKACCLALAPAFVTFVILLNKVALP